MTKPELRRALCVVCMNSPTTGDSPRCPSCQHGWKANRGLGPLVAAVPDQPDDLREALARLAESDRRLGISSKSPAPTEKRDNPNYER